MSGFEETIILSNGNMPGGFYAVSQIWKYESTSYTRNNHSSEELFLSLSFRLI